MPYPKPIKRTLEKALVQYPKIFNSLTEAAWLAYTEQELPSGYPSYAKALYNDLWAIQRAKPVSLILSKEDIEQELYMIWHEASTTFNQKKTKYKYRSILIGRGLFGLRYYLTKEMQIQTTVPKVLQEIEDPPPFDFDLQWLLFGTDQQPLCILDGFERELLYLRVQEKLSYKEIAKRLQRSDIESIRLGLERILFRLGAERNI